MADPVDRFGIFAPVFEPLAGLHPIPAYLELLNLERNAKDSVSLVTHCCRSVSDPYKDIGRLLVDQNWRPHLVAAVALSVSVFNRNAFDQLWFAMDAGSWVTPQLAAAAFLRDPAFVERARERLASGCKVVVRQEPGLTPQTQPVGRVPVGSDPRSAKLAASLVGLAKLCPQRPDWLSAQLQSPEVQDLLSKDVDNSGDIAQRWLSELREMLLSLGVKSQEGEARGIPP